MVKSSNTGFVLPEPEFGSFITDLVMELEYLKRSAWTHTTDSIIYSQLKSIFRDLDGMASARIEDNKTGLSKYLEAKAEPFDLKGWKTKEIDKIAETSLVIEDNYKETGIFPVFFTELHKILRTGITNEHDRSAGIYRRGNATSDTLPATAPAAHLIEPYMNKLINLINANLDYKYDTLKIAYAHHKFLWIHPFKESNGLMSRLLTQAMLLKAGFAGRDGRILNPTFAVATDPEKYIRLLKAADSDKPKPLFEWFEYVLGGLLDDIYRMERLFDYEFLKSEIIAPSLEHPLFDRLFTEQHRLIMNVAIDKQVFQANDIRLLFPNKQPADISKMLKWLKDKELIIPIEEKARKYAINLENKYLIKPIIAKFDKIGYLPFEK